MNDNKEEAAEAELKKGQDARGEKQDEGQKQEYNSKSLEDFPEEIRDYIKRLRTENKEKREKLNEYEYEKEKERHKKLKTDGKKDELIDELQKRVEDLKPKAEAWKKYENDKRDACKARLGDNWKDSFNNLPLQDLEHLAEAMTSGPALPPATDKRNNYGRGNSGTRTSEEKIATLYKS